MRLDTRLWTDITWTGCQQIKKWLSQFLPKIYGNRHKITTAIALKFNWYSRFKVHWLVLLSGSLKVHMQRYEAELPLSGRITVFVKRRSRTISIMNIHIARAHCGLHRRTDQLLKPQSHLARLQSSTGFGVTRPRSCSNRLISAIVCDEVSTSSSRRISGSSMASRTGDGVAGSPAWFEIFSFCADKQTSLV